MISLHKYICPERDYMSNNPNACTAALLSRSVLFAATLLSLTACNALNDKVTAESITDATVTFTPDEAMGGVAYWMYEFHADGVPVACNSNGNYYYPTSWEADNNNGVTVYFDGDWEDYTFYPDDGDLEEGSFDYDSSVGISMTGRYTSSKYEFPCSE